MRHGVDWLGHFVTIFWASAWLHRRSSRALGRSAVQGILFASLLVDPQSESVRPPLICHSSGGMFAIRDGQWKLIAGNGSGGREQPKGKPFSEPWMLVDLSEDPGEKKNVADENPIVFERLKKTLLEIKGDD